MERKLTADVVTEEKVERISQRARRAEARARPAVAEEARPALGPQRRPARSRASTRRPSRPMCAAATTGCCAARGQGDVLRLRPGRRLSGAARDGGRDRPAARGRVADPRDRPVRQVSSAVLKKPFCDRPARRPAGSPRRRRGRRPTTPTLAELQFPTMELYAMPAATAALLDDAAVDIDQWIAERGRDGLRRAGGRGLRQRRRHQEAEGLSRATPRWPRRAGPGARSAISPPASPARLPASDPSDVLIDPVYALKAGYRQNAQLGDEPQDAGRDPQAQGRRRQLSLAAAGGRRPARHADELPAGRGRGHAGHRREQRRRSPSAISRAAI